MIENQVSTYQRSKMNKETEPTQSTAASDRLFEQNVGAIPRVDSEGSLSSSISSLDDDNGTGADSQSLGPNQNQYYKDDEYKYGAGAGGDGTEDTILSAENDDDIARAMSKMISSPKSISLGLPLSLGVSLAKRAGVIESINWLGRHVPTCVLSEISKDVLCRTGTDVLADSRKTKKTMELPHAIRYEAALLFIDMSGFTKLSQSLDVESLSKVRATET